MEFSADILKQFNLDDHQGEKTVKNRQDGKSEHDSYVGAPYNFVPFSQRVQPYPGTLPKQNDVAGDLISGRITYELKAVTDIAVGGWNDGRTIHSYVDSYGNLAIPGSSVRGLVRANAQIPNWINVWFQLRSTPKKIRGILKLLPIFTTGTSAARMLMGA